MNTTFEPTADDLAETIESLHDVLDAAGASQDKLILYSIYRVRRELCLSMKDREGAAHWGYKIEAVKAEVAEPEHETDGAAKLIERITTSSEVAIEIARGSLITARLLVQHEGKDYPLICRYRAGSKGERTIEATPVGLALAFGREDIATYLVENDANFGITVNHYDGTDRQACESSYPIEIALDRQFEKAARAMFARGERLDRQVKANGITVRLAETLQTKRRVASFIQKIGYGHLIDQTRRH
jgi:hypothetical protein